MHAADMTQTLDGLQRHNHLNRRTIWVSDDVPRSYQGVRGVHLRHHQRHIVVHTKSRGVIYHDGSVMGDGVRIRT